MCVKSRFFAILLFITGAAPFQLFSQSAKGFTITGHLDGFEDSVMAYLFNRNGPDWHVGVGMDSCVVLGGNFHLKGKDYVPEGPRTYFVMFYKGINGHSLGKDLITDPQEIEFLVDNGDKITLEGNIQQYKFKDIRVSGSPSNDAKEWALSVARYALSCNRTIQRRLRKIRDSIGYEKNLVEEQIVAKRNLDKYLDSVTQNVSPDHKIGIPYLILTLNGWLGIYHGYFQKELLAKLPPALQNSYFGKQAKNIVAVSIGQPFPEFIFQTPEGNKIALKDFSHSGKITLVHFWGTTSVDREIYQNELKVMYNKFHAKGLNVIGVSADTTRDDWEFMIHQKKYPWVNVIAEPKGWGEGSVINDVYGEGGHFIPNTTNVLLDNKGNILAWDVYGAELQYYLGKNLGE